MTRERTILIRKAGFQNKGAEALACTARNELSKRLSNARICLELPYFEEEAANSVGFVNVKSVAQSLSRKTKIRYLLKTIAKTPSLGFIAHRNPRAIVDLHDVPDDLSAVIDVSGYGYGDPWGLSGAYRTYAYLKYCQTRRIPYIFLPQTWGPFTNKTLARCCRNFRLGTCFYAREEESVEHLHGLFGDRTPQIKLAPDIAFRLPREPLNPDHEIFSFIEKQAGNPIIAIAPNMRVYERMPGEYAANEYLKVLVHIARNCINRGCSLLLLPHEISLGRRSTIDDRLLCLLIERELKDVAERVYSVVDSMPAQDFKAAISKCFLLIGSRYHCIVGALSSRVPVLAIGWSHKYDSLMQSVSLKDFVLQVDNINFSTAKELVGRISHQRDKLMFEIDERIKVIEAQIDSLFDDVASIVASKN